MDKQQECTCVEDSGVPALCPMCRAAMERLFDRTDPFALPAADTPIADGGVQS